MARDTRRQFVKGVGVAAGVGLAGCMGGDGGDGNGGDGSDGGDGESTGGDGGDGSGADDGDGATDGGSTTPGASMKSVTIVEPEGTLFYPYMEAGVENGFYEEQGLDLTVEYLPFPAQVQSVSNGEYDTAHISVLPYLDFFNRGDDLVTYGFNGGLQLVNSLYVLTSTDYRTIQDLKGERIGVWSFGSSTVQSFMTVVAEKTGLRFREDFETTVNPPPVLLGLLNDGEVDGIIDVSSFSITMESQPDKYRNVAQLNKLWQERTGFTLPLTSWWSSTGWYEGNTDVAAALMAGAAEATKYWRENTESILMEYGEVASIDTQAKIDVCVEWANEGQVFLAEQSPEYLDATWEFFGLANEYGFLNEVPEQSAVLKDPLA